MPSSTPSPASATQHDPTGGPAGASRPLRGPVLVCTEGTGTSHAPTVAAWFIAQHLGCRLVVVSVIEPAVQYADASTLSPVPVFLMSESSAAREGRVRAFLAEALPSGAQFTLGIRHGPMTQEIAAAVQGAGASLLVVGAAPHRRRTGYLAGVRAAQLLRRVRCPVLAVDPGLASAPRHVVVAVDFSAASVRAAREAAELVGTRGAMVLVHAVPAPGRVGQGGGPASASSGAGSSGAASSVAAASGTAGSDPQALMLERLRKRMLGWAPAGLTITARIATGSPVEAVLRTAAEVGADLIAVGTHGPNVLERMFLGSVAASLLHQAPCSVLAAPEPEPADRLDLELEVWTTTSTYEEREWGPLLGAFTAANRGRHAVMEVDDTAIGAGMHASGYALHEVAYDATRKLLHVTLDAPSRGGHITRTLAHVSTLAMVRDRFGHDSGLLLRSGPNQTLLLLETERWPI